MPPTAATAQERVAAAFAADNASGAVAVRDGNLVGFLLGAPKASTVWGPNLWVESAGQALADDEPAEAVRDLYAAAATRWVEEGRTAQYVVAPAVDDALLDAWYRLGFGHQQTHAARAPMTTPPRVPEGLTIRRATRARRRHRSPR